MGCNDKSLAGPVGPVEPRISSTQDGREFEPHLFRDGFYRMAQPGDVLPVLHIDSLRVVCRNLSKGYLLAMSHPERAIPGWISADEIKIRAPATRSAAQEVKT